MATNPRLDHRPLDTLWAHVHALNTLASLGSFTAAARRLGLSKAAMSQRIAELERAAGTALVTRTTRSLRLTEAGERLVADTEGAFARIEAAFAGVRDAAGQARGRVRVTAPVALARQQIVPRLSTFLQAHPLVRLELDLSDRLATLAHEGFDLAIRHTDRVPETHVAWKLCDTRSVLAASRAYLRRHGEPRSPAELSRHACLHYPRPGEGASWSFEPASGRGARVSVAIAGPLAANNSEALRDAALDSMGIALLPDFTAQSALQAGKLIQVLPSWRPAGSFASQIVALRPYSPHVPRAVQALVAHLRESLAGGFPA